MAERKKNLKLLLWLVLAVIVIGAIAIWSGVMKHRSISSAVPKIAGMYLPQPRHDLQPFQLTTTDNKPFTNESLKGHWTMMFFGFTNCGMVCPTTMAALNSMYRQLQESLPDSRLPVVVMVTVDPERDSLSRMNEYVTSFNPNFIGARVEIAETIALEKQLHIAAAKIQADVKGKNHYTIDHSAEILLFNPDGELQAYLSWPHDAYQMSQDYRAILNASIAHG